MFVSCFFKSSPKSMGKLELILKEPDQARMRLEAFEVRGRVEKKRNIDATTETSGTLVVAALANYYQVTDYVMSQCGLEALIKLSRIVAPRNIEDMKMIDIRNDLIKYLKPQKRLMVAECTGFLQLSRWEKKQKPTTLLGSQRLCVIVRISVAMVLRTLKLKGFV